MKTGEWHLQRLELLLECNRCTVDLSTGKITWKQPTQKHARSELTRGQWELLERIALHGNPFISATLLKNWTGRLKSTSDRFISRLREDLGDGDNQLLPDEVPLLKSAGGGDFWFRPVKVSPLAQDNEPALSQLSLTPSPIRAEAIYIPHMSISSLGFLAAAYQLWDTVHLLVPSGWQLHHQPATSSALLQKADPSFFKALPLQRFIELNPGCFDRAFLRYEELIESLPERFLEDGNTTVEIWPEKTTPALRSLWNESGFLNNTVSGPLSVPRIAADLWLVCVGWTLAERDGLPLLTDDPWVEELLTACLIGRWEV